MTDDIILNQCFDLDDGQYHVLNTDKMRDYINKYGANHIDKACRNLTHYLHVMTYEQIDVLFENKISPFDVNTYYAYIYGKILYMGYVHDSDSDKYRYIFQKFLNQDDEDLLFLESFVFFNGEMQRYERIRLLDIDFIHKDSRLQELVEMLHNHGMKKLTFFDLMLPLITNKKSRFY